MREDGFPATSAGEADVIFLAIKDDPRMLLVLRATKRCFRSNYSAEYAPKREPIGSRLGRVFPSRARHITCSFPL